MSDFNLTNQFGFECLDEGLNPSHEPTHNPNSPHANISNSDRSQEKVKSLNGLPLSFDQEKNKNKNCTYKRVEPTNHTQHTQHQKIFNLGSYHTDPVKDDDPEWGPLHDP